MSTSTKLTMALVAVLTMLSIVGVYLALWCSSDFDKTYDASSADDADLLLRVKYQIEGIAGDREYVAYYRQRPRGERLNERYKELRGFIHLKDVGGPNCQTEGSSSGTWYVTPYQVADGVELSISLYQDHTDKFSGKVLIPLIPNPSGRTGKISYTAFWERP